MYTCVGTEHVLKTRHTDVLSASFERMELGRQMEQVKVGDVLVHDDPARGIEIVHRRRCLTTDEYTRLKRRIRGGDLGTRPPQTGVGRNAERRAREEEGAGMGWRDGERPRPGRTRRKRHAKAEERREERIVATALRSLTHI